MNAQLLKSPGMWVSLAAGIIGLLVAKGIILDGSTLQTVLGYIVALAGSLTGHAIAAGPAAPAAA